jgi:hypothetical protein
MISELSLKTLYSLFSIIHQYQFTSNIRSQIPGFKKIFSFSSSNKITINPILCYPQMLLSLNDYSFNIKQSLKALDKRLNKKRRYICARG